MSDALAQHTMTHVPTVGRRPVFDRDLTTVAYELVSASASRRSGDDMTMIRALADGALDPHVGSSNVLLRLSGMVLARDLPTLPYDRLIVDVHPMDIDDVAHDNLIRMKQHGAKILLSNPGDLVSARLLDLADGARLDVRAPSVVKERAPRLRSAGLDLLADNVETHDHLRTWQEQGFDWFQGWFLLEPDTHASGIPHDRLSLLRLLAAVDDPDRDLDEIEHAVSAQPALSYRLLRYVNSAYMGLRHKVDSIRQGIVTVGPAAMRDLITVTMLESVQDKPRELMRTVLVRAKLSEYLAPSLNVRPSTAFLVGLFTGLDAVVDRPRAEIIDPLPLSTEVSSAILRLEGQLGAVAALAIAYERCDWSHPLFRAQDIGELAEVYLKAVAWVELAMPSSGEGF